MLNSIVLAASTGKYREVPVGEATLYALLGFAVVFIGIAFLIFVVWLVGKIMSKDNGTKTEKTVKIKEPKPQEKQEEALAVADATEEISEETIAIITAAIMAYYQTSQPKCEFRVKRIKRI